jgi:hypothetical protein
MFEQARKEVRTAAAKVELNSAQISLRVLQGLIGRIDRDEAVIREAIEFSTYMRQTDLVRKLRSLLEPVTVPYAEIEKNCADIGWTRDD